MRLCLDLPSRSACRLWQDNQSSGRTNEPLMSTLSRIRALSSRKSRLARKYLRGSGLEIGALHSPTQVRRGVAVQYVDRLSGQELAAHYPELDSSTFVAVDVVDDAETLESVGDDSQDFVIASHVLEHCEDPIGALENWLRVVRVGGYVLLAVPNRDRSFDRSRSVTTWEHLLRDHEGGPEGSRSQHYLEWATLVEGKAGDDARRQAMALEESRYSIHFHVWDWPGFRSFLGSFRDDAGARCAVDEERNGGQEFLSVLRRS